MSSGGARRARQLLTVAGLLGAFGGTSGSAQQSVVSTVHNLSVSGPGEIRSLSETEVCKFCHIPHNAVSPQPLWGHALSTALYQVPDLRSGGEGRRPAPQPDGSSRLCLSCHDGTVALGDVAGEPRSIRMVGADRLTSARSSGLGTDLSGSHPISFVVEDGHLDPFETGRDMGLRPLADRGADAPPLDGQGKMQCTTCHDPHADRYYVPDRVPRFWRMPSVDEVCLSCHVPL